MESLIKLTVKTPNQRIEDIEIDCDLKWTVLKLKEYLQDVYPSRPSSSSQKLIYLGRLLQDHLLLKEVFGEWGSQTLHIVCTDNSTQTSGDCTTSTNVVSSVAMSTPSSSMSSTDGVRRRHQSSATTRADIPATSMMTSFTSSNQFYTNPLLSSYSTPNLMSHMYHQYPYQHSNEQHPYHQQMQMYYQQLHHWHALMAAQTYAGQMSPGSLSQSPPGSPITSFPRPHSADDINQAHIADNQHPPAQRPVPPAEDENVQMNAGPGEVQDDFDNGRNRDWLDWIYMSLRGLVLFSFIYFYSSTSRFLMVSLLAFLIYLYKAGWFTPQRVRIRELNFEDRDGAPGQRDEQANENRDSTQDNSDVNNETTTNTNIQLQQPSVFTIFWTFCKAFFGSLIPTPPPRPVQP